MTVLRFIDLFAGIGGIRKGFELACTARGIPTKCVFTSEIKPYAVDVLKQNHPDEEINGDITQIQTSEIPDFDFLLAGCKRNTLFRGCTYLKRQAAERVYLRKCRGAC